MTPISAVKRISPEVGLEEALEQMGTNGVNQMPVMKDGQLEGMLTREDIINYLRILQNLEK
jgi:CBS domain-containing protein